MLKKILQKCIEFDFHFLIRLINCKSRLNNEGIDKYMDCTITPVGLLEQIIGEIVKMPCKNYLAQRIYEILKKADSALLAAIIGSKETDIHVWVHTICNKDNDDLNLIKLFTHAIMGTHHPHSIIKNEEMNSSLMPIQEISKKPLSPRFLSPLPNEILKICLKHYISNDPDWYALGNFAMTCIPFYNLATEASTFCELLRHGRVHRMGMSKKFVLSKLPLLNKINKVSLNFIDSEEIDQNHIPSLFSCGEYKSFKFKGLQKEKSFINTRVWRNLIEHSPNLKHLTFLGAEEITNESIFYLAAGCKKLSSIKLRNCKNVTSEALIALAACSKLHSIDLDVLENKNRPVMNFRGKTFDIPINGFDKWAQFLTKHQNKLNKLQLGNLFFSHSAFEDLVSKFAPTLNKIGLLSALEHNKNAFNPLKTCANLQHLKLFDKQTLIDNSTLEYVSKNWSELKSCTILSSQNLSSVGIEALLKNCQKLEKLTLDNYKIDAETIQIICSHAISLTELHFPSSCGTAYDFNVDDLIEILAKNKAPLSKLKLVQFSILGKEILLKSLTTLANSFPELEFVVHSKRLPSKNIMEDLEKLFPDFQLNSYL